MGRKEAFRFLPVFFTVLVDFLGLAIVVPIFAPMLLHPETQSLGATLSLNVRAIILGFLTAVYPLCGLFSAPYLGRLSDRHGRKPFLLITVGITAFGYVVSAVSVELLSIIGLFVGRALTGIGGGNVSIAESIVADLSDEKTKATYFGYLTLAMGIGFILGPVLGGKLADPRLVSWFAYDIPFWASAILAVINVIIVAWGLPETHGVDKRTPKDAPHGWKDFSLTFRLPGIKKVLLTFLFFVIGWWFFALFFQVYMIQMFDFNSSDVGDTYTYIGVFYAVFQVFVSGPISKRFRPRLLVQIALIGLTIGYCTLLIPTTPQPMFIIFPFLALFACIAWPNILSVVSTVAGPKKQGEVMGITQAIQSFAQAITPIISGPLIAHHLMIPTVIGIVSTGIAWILAVFIPNPPQTGYKQVTLIEEASDSSASEEERSPPHKSS